MPRMARSLRRANVAARMANQAAEKNSAAHAGAEKQHLRALA